VVKEVDVVLNPVELFMISSMAEVCLGLLSLTMGSFFPMTVELFRGVDDCTLTLIGV
jgi:hypothetical protein